MDKALSHKTVQFLKDEGYDAFRVNELLPGESIEDEEIFNFAIDNDYVILTADVDFGKLLAYRWRLAPINIFSIRN